MTLDEAIEHCKDISSTCNITGCANDHLQLMDWLIELKKYRQTFGTIFNEHNKK